MTKIGQDGIGYWIGYWCRLYNIEKRHKISQSLWPANVLRKKHTFRSKEGKNDIKAQSDIFTLKPITQKPPSY